MNKLQIAVLRKLAQAEGYKGDPLDAEAMRKHILTLDSPITTVTVAGVDIDIKTATIELPASRRVTVDEPKPEPATKTPDPAGLDVKIAGQVEAAVKAALAANPGGRPPTLVDDIQVKDSEEVWYDGEVAKATKLGLPAPAALMKSYPTLKAFSYFLAAKAAAAMQKEEPREANTKLFKEWGERSKKFSAKALTTISVTGGAALVPSAFEAELINHRNEYGVARRIARVIAMTAGQVTMPRRTGGCTAYWQVEGATVTEASPTTNNINLTAKTLMAISKFSRQMVDDAALSVASFVFDELAYAITKAEDDAFFIGNGTATYGNITGFNQKYGTSAASDGGGYLVVGGDTTAAHTLADFHRLMGRLPTIFRNRAIFVANPELAAQMFDRLSHAQGGVTLAETANGGYQQKFLGRPVVLTNSLPNNSAQSGDLIDCLYGDFMEAAKFGDRVGLELDMTDQRYWDEHNIGAKGVCRVDINVHDVGSTTAAGPVISFWQT